MAEHEVMWIGRRPAAMAPAENPAATEDFAAAVTQACADCGCEVQDYIAAAGVYGSWMVRFLRKGGKHRIVWNGKEGRLVLERAVTAVDWQETHHESVADRTQAGFVAAVGNLLNDQAPAWRPRQRDPRNVHEHVHGPDCDHDHDHEHVHAPAEPYRRMEPKLGRNDPCFCGSGRKYKKCHGAAT